MDCSIGIMACNEEKNIGRLLDALFSQRLSLVSIKEIIVVAGGCTDNTCVIVETASAADPRIKLIVEPCRAGKAAAINMFLKNSACGICILIGGDTLPDPDAVENLVSPFENAAVGMSGARIVPLNDPATLTGYIVHFLWRVHHEVSLIQPKCGEAVAFRRVFDSIPTDTIVDEPQIEALVRDAGLRALYAQNAIVYNLGPARISEIIMRRRSIVRGYLELSRRTKHRSSTQARGAVAKIVISRMLSGQEPLLRASAAVAVELAARLLGRIDHHLSRNPGHIWRMADSTKELPHDLRVK